MGLNKVYVVIPMVLFFCKSKLVFLSFYPLCITLYFVISRKQRREVTQDTTVLVLCEDAIQSCIYFATFLIHCMPLQIIYCK